MPGLALGVWKLEEEGGRKRGGEEREEDSSSSESNYCEEGLSIKSDKTICLQRRLNGKLFGPEGRTGHVVKKMCNN